MDNNEFYIPHLEWAFADFPIRLSKLDFEKSNWGFDQDSFIEINRSKGHDLDIRIYGNVSYPEKMKDEDYVGKGNIIEGQEIRGLDKSGDSVVLKGCHLIHFQTNSRTITRKGFIVEGELRTDEFRIRFEGIDKSNLTNKTRLDWFSCSDVSARFSGTTFRNPKLSTRKIRKGIDEFDDSIENYIGSSSSKDYVLIKLSRIEFILSRVPEGFLPGSTQGICLEFRNNLEKVTNDLIVGIKSFVAFLLGNSLHHIGYSIIESEELLEACLYQKSFEGEKRSMPPIKFNFQYDWGDIGYLMNQFLPKYLELRKVLALDEVLSNYWIATELPLGVNLPILSSALETLALKYIKTLEGVKLEYIGEEEYSTLIKKELDLISDKLSSIEGYEVIVNKISGAFRKGPSEKMTLFYSAIGINIEKVEKKALSLRNQMAHGIRNYANNNDRAYDDTVLSRVYEVLFNRTILTLVDYKGYYVDYSMKGCPLKHISKPVGEK